MPKTSKPLSTYLIEKAVKKNKVYSISDTDGLSLFIYPSGAKIWKYRYSFNQKRNWFSIGGYPTISIKEARVIRSELEEELADGNDISRKKKELQKKEEDKLIKKMNGIPFKEIALSYMNHIKDGQNEKYHAQNISRLENDAFPIIGEKGINEVAITDIIKVINTIQDRGAIEYAKRHLALLGRIYKYAVTLQLANRNIIADIDPSVILRKREAKNFNHTIDPIELREVLLTIDNYYGDNTTKRALQVMPYLFFRSGMLRLLTWDEINFEKKMIEIPASKMKFGKDFVAPICKTVEMILEEQHKATRHISDYVFPSRVGKNKPLSDNALLTALKRLGFQLTVHGFRHTASTFLHENISIHKIYSDVIETQMAHTISSGSAVKQVYNKAQYLHDRIALMNWWEMFLNRLKKDDFQVFLDDLSTERRREN